MEQCPKCRSTAVRPSRSRSKWERWRKEITGKRPFRCPDCGWRGWGIDSGPSFVEVQRAVTGQELAPEPPNLERAGLSREMQRPDVRLEELDAMMDEEK